MLSRRPYARHNRGRVSRGGGGVALPAIFTLGDSQTYGSSGDVGGWLAQMTTPVTFVGPYTNGGGIATGGRLGDRLVGTGSNDMNGRFAAQWAATPAAEVWVTGGVNDFVSDGQNATQVTTDLSTLLDTIIAAVGNSIPIRVGSSASYSTAIASGLSDYWGKLIAQVVAAKRAAGAKVYFHHAGANVTLAGLDGDPGHPVDSAYGANGYGLWAQWQDRWLNDESISPAALSPVAWFRADTGYTPGTGVWLDQSGNGHNASPTGAGKPTVVTGQFGVTALRFSASPLRTSTWTALSQPNTILLVASGISATGTPAAIDGATVSARHLLQFTATTGIPGLYAGTGPVSDANVNAQTIGHMYLAEYNGASSKLYLDGNPRTTVFSIGAQQLTGLTIAGSAAATPSNTLAGDIYEIAVFDGLLTETQRFGLAHYCRARYGLWPLLGEVTSW